MSRTYHHRKDRNILVRGIRRPTDLSRLARTLIELEAAQAEAEAEAGHRTDDVSRKPGKRRKNR
jgi:hypothetical protein